MNWPKISVITPSYNQAEYLEQCILSVLEQDYPEFEYIIIDGGSTDNSIEIIQKHAHQLTYWVSEPDRGQAEAINKGFRRASGELVAWLNSDDFYLPRALKTIAEYYRRYPEAPFYFADGWRVDQTGRRKSRFYQEDYMAFNRSALVNGLNFILQPSTFIRRSALVEVNYLDTALHYGLDTDLWIRLSELGEPVPVPLPLAASREYGETKTSIGSFKRLEELRRIAEKYSGEPVTPGYLCYFMDTLRNYVKQHSELYPDSYVQALDSFWASTSNLLAVYGAHPKGDPFNNRRIGIDFRQIAYGTSGGIAFHLKGVLEALFRIAPDYEFFVFGTIYNRDIFSVAPENVHMLSLPTSDFFHEMDKILVQENIDILFRGYPSQDVINFPINRQIFFVPDIQHDEFPSFFEPMVLEARQQAFRHALNGAGAIGTNTPFTRHTILMHKDCRCDDVFLMPPALSSLHVTEEEAFLHPEEEALVPDKPFFYYPANLWPHKNHSKTLQAFKLFLETTGEDMELILTGHLEGWENLKAAYPGLPVRHLGFVRQALVNYLYRNATALVFFSLYEGFGMPLLEAFHAGTPVICSNVTSLPEVGGDAVLYGDPNDVEEMSELMVRVVQNEELRAALIRRGKEREAHYTWEESAQNLMDAIRRVSNRVRIARPAAESFRYEESSLPLVSIVTPSYNQGRYLPWTIESVLNQTYPNIEYLIIDGASTDGSVDILKSYGECFTWISEPDKGQVDAINKGFQMAHGEILAYLNSDDVLEPDAVETVVDYFVRNEDVDMIYGRAFYIDDEDHITGMYRTDEYSFSRMVWDNCICQPAAFWRRRIADLIGPFDSSLNFAMDHDYWMRIDRAGGKIMHIHEILARSRLYPQTKTLSFRSEIYDEIFQISQRHAGYVSLNYFQGLWHHRIWEKEASPYRFLRLIPGSFRFMAHLHLALYHRKWPNRLQPKNIIYQLRRWVYAFSNRWFGFLRPLARYIRFNFYLVSSDKPIFGLFYDDWLGPIFQVYIKRKAPGQQFYISGIPSVDTEMVIKQERDVVQKLQLTKDQPVDIAIRAEAGQRVLFAFSEVQKDPAGRNLSFLVTGQNLFSEQDVIY